MRKIVGFDIGENSVKMAYFADGALKKAVKAELPDAMVAGGRILSMDAMADFLRETAKANGIPLTNAALSVSGSEVFVRTLTMPAMTEQQLKYNLPYEFHNFLTEEKQQYFFDYSVRAIRRDEDGTPREMELLACAMRKSAVEAYRAMFRRAGFRLRIIVPAECAYGAVLEAYIKRAGGEDKDRCIINIGHSAIHLYMFHGTEFDAHREIDMGGRMLDEKIAEAFGVDIHIAHGYMHSNYNGVLEADYATELYGRAAVEILKAVNFYNYSNRERRLEEIYVCGGGGGIEPLLRAIRSTAKLELLSAETLLAAENCPDKAWSYLCAIGSVNEGLRGGLA